MRWQHLIVLPFLVGAAQAGSLPTIPPYTATYEAQAYGNRLIVRSTLNPEGENLRMAMDAQVSGFLRLLGRFEFSRESVFQPAPDGLRVLQTRSRQVTPRRERNTETQFDWSTGRARGQDGDRTFDLEVPPGTLDFLSSLYQTMTELGDGAVDATESVTILERRRLREYTVAPEGRERIQTALGRMDAVKIVRKDNDRDVELAGWFAPDLHYLPVRLDYESDGDVFRLELTKLEWHARP